ncbi:MAG: hypothetical protein HOW71_29590, partial [Nonomuraea sp.]|nr:hypothetical protein [Nonomuraea sp.]
MGSSGPGWVGSCDGSGSEVSEGSAVGFGEVVGVALLVVGVGVGDGVTPVLPLGRGLAPPLVGGAGWRVARVGLLELVAEVVSSAGGNTSSVVEGSAGR